jgi:hypothetical protein
MACGTFLHSASIPARGAVMLKSLFIKVTCNDMASKFQQCFTCACPAPRDIRTGPQCDCHSVTPAISLTGASTRQHPAPHLIDETEAGDHIVCFGELSRAG